ncbi:MAG: hypothetical protein QM820_32895 [Minicystis sp.]
MPARPVHRCLATALLLLIAAACSTPPPAPSTPAPTPTPAPTSAPADAAAPTLASTSAAPAAAGAPTPTAAPAPQELAPRTGAAGNTRGFIACGKLRCDAAKEVCAIVDGPAWACIPQAQKEKASAFYECDDGTDCPWGKTCCRSFASAAEYYVCTTRDNDCSVEVCAEGGARCPAGQTCQQGFCAPARPALPTCGRRAACSADKPICAWQQGKGECVSRERAAELSEKSLSGAPMAFLRCTQNSDCGAGFHCCTGGAMGWQESFCSLRCDLMNTRQYCDSDADCPKLPGMKLTCQKPDGDLPAWSKLCGN